MPRVTSHATSNASTNASTRAASARSTRRDGALLEHGELVASVESGLSYRIGPLLGQGGFGQVFPAARVGGSDRVPEAVCVKVSTRQDGWLREAYFGQLLHDHPRAVRLYDAFPFFGRDGRLLYGLAMEYACLGDLSAFLARGIKRWTETAVRREIAGVLHVLQKLHRGQHLHRDLTPLNVFVCDGYRLKLGDFGIVRQQSDHRGVTARTLNPLMAPSDIFDGAAPKWQARDDVYQVGQLIGTLGVPRSEAAKAARRAGATVHAGASAKVTVVVCGRPNVLQAAGKDGGRKLLEIKRLREKGLRIALLSEAQFWRLAGRPAARNA